MRWMTKFLDEFTSLLMSCRALFLIKIEVDLLAEDAQIRKMIEIH